MSADQTIVERATATVDDLRQHNATIESERRLPKEVVEALASQGFFRMLAPRAVGGLEVSPSEFVRVLETLAQGDSAAAWCAMVSSTTALATAYLPVDVAAELWSGPEPLAMAGVFAPMGRVERRESAYSLTGRWPFASGCLHAEWFMLGGVMPAVDGSKSLGAFFVPREDVVIHDTWDVSGLRGTGSHDVSVASVHVPSERVVVLVDGKPQHEGALFRFPIFGLLACGVAAVGLGIARAAIDDFMAANCQEGRHSRAAADSLVQVAVAGAEGKVRAARALFDQELERVFRSEGEGKLGPVAAADIRLAALHATSAAREAVDAIYHASGGAAVYVRNRQERHFRDIHVLTQHIMVSPRASKLVARVLMRMDTDTSQL